MTTTTLEPRVDEFLAQKRIAVVGVSRDSTHHAATNHTCMRWVLKFKGGLPV